MKKYLGYKILKQYKKNLQGNNHLKKLYHHIVAFLCLFSLLISKTEQINLHAVNNLSYISLNALSHQLELKTKFFPDNSNVEVTINKKTLTFSNGSSFCKINSNVYHLYSPVIYKKNDFLIPAFALVNILKSHNVANNININSSHNSLLITYNDFNITSYNVHKKTNGFIIDLITTHTFDDNLIPIWKSNNNWISINIPNGIIDIESIKKIPTPHPKIQKKQYIIDKIVLDAGHGGKDPGACSHKCKIKEKDITLDITKKIGKTLENKFDLEVIYTREDDRFVSLRNRSNLANNSIGDLFISIHVNSIANSPRTKGFEVYFLDPDKSLEAANEVAKFENSVIEKYESNSNIKITAEELRKATIMHKNNFEQSYDLAQHIKNELSRTLSRKLNRGIKQQMFHVLWKVTMPNVLVEVGFITNKEESNNLTNEKYQQKIADAIAQAVINYKSQYEKQILQ